MHQYRLPSIPISSYPPATTDDHSPLITGGPPEPVFDGDEEMGIGAGAGQGHEGEMVPYAHRDIKPGYVYSQMLMMRKEVGRSDGRMGK